ncbi:MAG: hypothetical protein IJ770_03135 [Alphaproteobacteria bacterium]|nr:hypothetical protein [Alphaproteobacteria bacterium]
MKKIKFTGTVDTFYFIPNCEEETAVIYLDVSQEQKLPDGREETVMPARRMRFVLNIKELGVLAKEKTVARGDQMSIFVCESPNGELSYSIGLIGHSLSVVDAKEYVKHLV